MTYTQAMRIALLRGWGDLIRRDNISGNGFQITAYGLKLIAIIFIRCVVRFVFAVLFPITALIIMWYEKDDDERRKQMEEAMGDL